MVILKRGEKKPLSQLTSARQIRAGFGTASGLKFDFCCFGLGENARLLDERHFVFYNNKSTPNKSIEIVGEREGQAMTFAVDLDRLPFQCHRLVFAFVVDGEGQISQLSGGQFSLMSEGIERARFNLVGSDFGVEKSLIAAEIYKRDDSWRVGAVGQGFCEGMEALLRHYGGEVVRAKNSTPRSPSPTSGATPNSPREVSPSPPARETNSCVRCGKVEGRLGQILGIGALDRTTRRCKECEVQVRAAFERLRIEFGQAGQSGGLDVSQWNALWARFEGARTGANRSQALAFLRPDALRFMERLVVMAASDGVITAQEEQYIWQMCQFLELSEAEKMPFRARLEHVKKLASIRQGHLPQASAGDNHLDAGEICHLYITATYHKVNSRSTTLISGRLMATNKKLVFLSPNGGTVIQWKNIMTARATSHSLYLELATRNGNGTYQVDDPHWCEAVVTALTRIAKRQLLTPQSDNPTRHIPQDVKTAVWQRDGGRCVQCRADSYLEFDHIIRFSKGGANTLNNVQLLCRKCNGEKGDRI